MRAMSLRAQSSLLGLLIASGVANAGCATAPKRLDVPPPTSARPSPANKVTSSSITSPTRSVRDVVYAGHGADSVPPEVLAKFAPTPLPGDVSRRIQAMLDVRAPIGSRLSPDGRNMYFAWNVSGVMQVWREDGARRFPVQLTGGEDVTRVLGVMPDGKNLLVSRDRKGEENPGLYLLSEGGGALRPIQHVAKVQTFLSWVEKDGKAIWFRANDVKPDSFAIYRWEVATGKKELVFGEPGLWGVGEVLVEGPSGKVLLEKHTGAMTSEWFEYDVASKKLTPLLGQDEKEEYDVAVSADPGEVLVRTPKFGEFRRVYRVKRAALKGGPLAQADATPLGPEAKHDVTQMGFDRAKRALYLTTNEGGYTRLRVLDGKTLAPLPLPAMEAGDHVSLASATWDGKRAVINVTGATTPATSWVVDWDAKKADKWLLPSTPEVDTASFAVAKETSYPARDGTPIPAFVRKSAACASPPAGAPPCPVIVHFHGGPEGQSMPGFNTYAQIFVDAGFIWVDPNVRGSEGYGKTWLHADDGPKRLAVVTDIEDAAKWARTAFAHDGKTPKVGVFGGSYGGYSTLAAMTMFAGAYDAGVANVGMSNLLTFLQNTAPYRRALRASEYGDPEKDREALVQLSPITHIDKVKAPLMLIQGASDPRVPIGEALQMHAALEKNGRTTKMIVFPDEGHGAQKRENKVLEIGHTLEFFETHLLGRGGKR